MSATKPQTALQHFDTSADIYEANTGGCTRDLAEVAIQLMHDLKPIDSGSIILDNACGSGVATDALICFLQHMQSKPEIFAADGSENMTSIAARRFHGERVHVVTAPGEKLPYPDETFSHSITNLGLMFFDDARAGAAEILRTLKPGGVAVITGWIDLGYVEAIREAQRMLMPAAQPFHVPLGDDWLNPAHTQNLLEETGFLAVQVLESPAYFGAQTVQGLVDLLKGGIGKSAFSWWSEVDQKEAEDCLRAIVQRDGVHFTRHKEVGTGLKMRGSVFSCRRG